MPPRQDLRKRPRRSGSPHVLLLHHPLLVVLDLGLDRRHSSAALHRLVDERADVVQEESVSDVRPDGVEADGGGENGSGVEEEEEVLCCSCEGKDISVALEPCWARLT